MKKNVGAADRWARVVVAAGLLTCSVMAPLDAALRIPLFGALGLYMAFTALAGTCLGYRLIGRSSCAVEPRA
jgi:hypothetical protein